MDAVAKEILAVCQDGVLDSVSLLRSTENMEILALMS